MNKKGNKTNKQANKQTNKQTSEQTNKQTKAGGTPAVRLFRRRICRPIGCRRIGTSRGLVPSTFSHPGGPIRALITDNGTSLGLVPIWAQSGGPTKPGLVGIRAQSGGFELVGMMAFFLLRSTWPSR